MMRQAGEQLLLRKTPTWPLTKRDGDLGDGWRWLLQFLLWGSRRIHLNFTRRSCQSCLFPRLRSDHRHEEDGDGWSTSQSKCFSRQFSLQSVETSRWKNEPEVIWQPQRLFAPVSVAVCHSLSRWSSGWWRNIQTWLVVWGFATSYFLFMSSSPCRMLPLSGIPKRRNK